MKDFIVIVILLVVLTNSALGVTPIDDSDTCTSCQQTIQSWQDTWTNETSIDNVISSLKNNCKEKYSIKDILKRELCDKVVDVLVQIPPGIFDGLNSLAWPIPSALCATIRKCDLYCCDDSNSPEQIHLSADTDTSIMTGNIIIITIITIITIIITITIITTTSIMDYTQLTTIVCSVWYFY
jgi:hypothetical protein